MSGNQVRDRANSLDLLKAAFLFAARNIRCTHGSKLVMKYFESQEAQDFRRKGERSNSSTCWATLTCAHSTQCSRRPLIASRPSRWPRAARPARRCTSSQAGRDAACSRKAQRSSRYSWMCRQRAQARRVCRSQARNHQPASTAMTPKKSAARRSTRRWAVCSTSDRRWRQHWPRRCRNDDAPSHTASVAAASFT